jgi:hypothetical protein
MREKILSISMDDLVFQTFRAGGKGGQKQNKTSSGVRLIHTASGARGESRSQRSQTQNKKEAFQRLIDSEIFKCWLKIEISRRCGLLDDVEAEVERLMAPGNILVEVHSEKGTWVEEQPDLIGAC